jgi:hypothetical protein
VTVQRVTATAWSPIEGRIGTVIANLEPSGQSCSRDTSVRPMGAHLSLPRPSRGPLLKAAEIAAGSEFSSTITRTVLECQASNMVHSDACPRPTTSHPAGAPLPRPRARRPPRRPHPRGACPQQHRPPAAAAPPTPPTPCGQPAAAGEVAFIQAAPFHSFLHVNIYIYGNHFYMELSPCKVGRPPPARKVKFTGLTQNLQVGPAV